MVEPAATRHTTRYLLSLGYQAHILTERQEINTSIPEDFWGNIFFTWPAA
jgi:hypothetical protein